MAQSSLNGVLQHLRVVAAVQTHRQLSDRQLLERFVAGNDEAAFTVLIERHGPMVLGVCRRALGNLHDAEDACQATFLVLSRKAASIKKSAALSSWLHGVACRVAVRLKRDHARRQRREKSRTSSAPMDAAAQVSWQEVQAILDHELERLPPRYRTPLICCYLDGKTRDEAAQEIGVSLGTLHGRLERGRTLLRQRLTSRGLTLSATLFAAALGESSAQAALSPTFVVSSTRAALALASGEPLGANLVAAHVLTLTQGVLKTMFLTKLKVGTAALLCAGLVVAFLGGSFPAVGSAQDTKPAPATSTAPTPKTPEYRRSALAEYYRAFAAKPENDMEFIRRLSLDLRGGEPTPAEIHFFVTSKDANKRQKLIDLFIEERKSKQELDERKAKQDADAYVIQNKLVADLDRLVISRTLYVRATQQAKSAVSQKYDSLLTEYYKELLTAKEKGDVAKITHAYLDRLQQYVKDNPKNADVPEAMLQIVIIYGSQNKAVEADAWREKLAKEHPTSSAARRAKGVGK